MIVDRQFPRSYSSLIEAIKRETAESEAVVVNAGHFLLYLDEQEGLVPCIASEMASGRHDEIANELGQFPFLSWQLGCQIMTEISAQLTYLLVVVNDWQYVPAGADRQSFFKTFAHLPGSYVESARSVRGAKLLTPKGPTDFTATRPFFSERTLRNQYGRHFKRLIKQGALPTDVELQRNESGTFCSLIDVLGSTSEVYCAEKVADCANEIAELIDSASRLVNCDCFINLYPAVCKEFVERGSELPTRLFGTKLARIINIAVPATSVFSEDDLISGAEVSVHKF